jgi:hypothetical protein
MLKNRKNSRSGVERVDRILCENEVVSQLPHAISLRDRVSTPIFQRKRISIQNIYTICEDRRNHAETVHNIENCNKEINEDDASNDDVDVRRVRALLERENSKGVSA